MVFASLLPSALQAATGYRPPDMEKEIFDTKAIKLDKFDRFGLIGALVSVARDFDDEDEVDYEVRSHALAIAGRLAPTGGRLRVAGHLLPERAAWVRSHVGVALLAEADDPLAELAPPRRGPAQSVVIDGLDRLESEAMRDQAAALLRDAALARRERTGDGTSPLTILASTQREDTALALMTEARRIGVSSLTLSLRYEPTVPAPAEEHA